MKEKVTQKDVEKIQQEIDHRKLVVRKEAIEAVKEARAQGDLSENFEYYAAKKHKNQNESRIRYLERMIRTAKVIKVQEQADAVGLFDTVTIYNEMLKKEMTVRIVTTLDKMGYTHQFLPPRIRPLRDDMFIAGRAMTVLEADVLDNLTDAGNNPLLKRSFGLMLEALDDLREDEVYICSGSSPAYALWGELMSARAMQCKAAGAVVNGYSRDTKGILELDFACFSYGPYAQDQAPRGKVIDYRVPIDMEGVRINNGDMIIGDIDGVCVVPREIEEEVFERALEKARGERVVLKKIKEGMKAREAFDKYGIM